MSGIHRWTTAKCPFYFQIYFMFKEERNFELSKKVKSIKTHATNLRKNRQISMYHRWDYVWELNKYQKYFSPFYVSFSVKISFRLSLRFEGEKHAIVWHFKIHIINLTTSTFLYCSRILFIMSCTIWRQ